MVALPGPAETSAAHAVQATVLVSGIFELAPLLGTSINQALGLTLPVAQAMSPALQPLAGMAPSLVAWGEVETDEFKRQANDFADDLQAAGTHCQRLAVPERNHFDVILDLAKPGTLLGQAVLALLLTA
jgi:arylformamidase